MRIHDVGDLMHGPQRTMFEQLRFEVARMSGFPIILGGEHSLSAVAVEALLAKHPEMTVFVLDAHLDFRDDYQGQKASHACVVRRIHEITKQVTVMGVRSASHEELRDAQKAELSLVEMRDWNLDDLSLGDAIYLSIDMDVVDPSFAPSVGTPVFNGATPRQVEHLIQNLAPKLVGMDICEVTSSGPDNTAVLAGHFIQQMMAARLS